MSDTKVAVIVILIIIFKIITIVVVFVVVVVVVVVVIIIIITIIILYNHYSLYLDFCVPSSHSKLLYEIQTFTNTSYLPVHYGITN